MFLRAFDTMNAMYGDLYTLLLVITAIGCFQIAATGKWRSGRASNQYWKVPTWGRLVCLFIGIVATGVAIFFIAQRTTSMHSAAISSGDPNERGTMSRHVLSTPGFAASFQ